MRHDAIGAAVDLEKRELRQAGAVVDIRNPLAVRRPARMKCVVLEERQLVRLAAANRLHVEVRELVGRTSRGRIDETLSIDRDVRPRTIKRLLVNHRPRVVYPAR